MTHNCGTIFAVCVCAIYFDSRNPKSLDLKQFYIYTCRIDLYKEKNALHAEKLEHRKAGQRMPNPTRLSKARLSMNRIR